MDASALGVPMYITGAWAAASGHVSSWARALVVLAARSKEQTCPCTGVLSLKLGSLRAGLAPDARLQQVATAL